MRRAGALGLRARRGHSRHLIRMNTSPLRNDSGRTPPRVKNKDIPGKPNMISNIGRQKSESPNFVIFDSMLE